ncbi:MAG: glycosyltransferase [Elusimicrobiota bacterium]
MKIAVIAVGSRGDVQPFIALALGLKKAGHEVTVGTNLVFRDLVSSYGLDFTRVRPDSPKDFLEGRVGRLFASGSPVLSFLAGYWFFKAFGPMLGDILDDCLDACRGRDMVVNSLVSPGYQAALLLDMPCVMAGLWPASHTRDYPHPIVTFSFGGWFNRMTYTVTEGLMWTIFKRYTDKWTKKHGSRRLSLKKGVFSDIRKKGYPWIFGFSNEVLPKPSDWADNLHVTGYWYLGEPDGWEPPLELEEFIKSGSPPVYMGFGSMVCLEKEKLVEAFVEALEITGRRGVLFSGWSGLGEKPLPDNIYRTGPVPHIWLFPKMAAVIHHGGSQTTAASMQAGIPQLIIPFLADQFSWGRYVQKTRIGPEPIPKSRLNGRNLAEAVRTMLTDEEMRRNTKEMAERLSLENGVKKAVSIIEQFASVIT